jgi:hypothetical protein
VTLLDTRTWDVARARSWRQLLHREQERGPHRRQWRAERTTSTKPADTTSRSPPANAYVSIFGDYAYGWTVDKVTLVDVRSGSVVATRPKPSLYLIAADL